MPLTLLLLLWAPLALMETRAGSGNCKGKGNGNGSGNGEPRFIAVGYVDDTQFGRFDSGSLGRRAEPRAPWAGQVGQEDLDEETLIQRNYAQWFDPTKILWYLLLRKVSSFICDDISIM